MNGSGQKTCVLMARQKRNFILSFPKVMRSEVFFEPFMSVFHTRAGYDQIGLFRHCLAFNLVPGTLEFRSKSTMDHLSHSGYPIGMKRVFANISEVLDHGCDTVIDVRSPSEFAQDHWPGAINLPVLDDRERAEVGTLYKQVGPFEARVLGASYVTRNASVHLAQSLASKPGSWKPLVYCWRGGQRSGFFASLLTQVGWRVTLVEGGYKRYRRLVSAALHDAPINHRFILIDGNTGTAKTAILDALGQMGAQVLDLEGLANHRGSVFGARPGGQPSQKAFETALASVLARHDPSRPIFVEAESSKIGNLNVPPSVWDAMKIAPRIEVQAPLDARAQYLRVAYDDIFTNAPELNRILNGLVPLQGRERVDRWINFASSGAFLEMISELMQFHYDPRYTRSRNRLEHKVHVIEAPSLSQDDIHGLAEAVLSMKDHVLDQA
jgi:tRNA 2-selenouridine synthase